LWLAPTQLSILTVTEEVNDYALSLKEKFDAINLRVELDNRNEKIGYKIREHSNAKVPLMAVIGKDEMSANTVSIRNLRKNETNTYSIDEVLELLEVNSSSPK
jgi:threonyl-tRNA synthetase